MAKQKTKEEILEVLRASKDAPGALEIMKRLKRKRISKALNELEKEGVIEWSFLAEGWRLRKEAKGVE